MQAIATCGLATGPEEEKVVKMSRSHAQIAEFVIIAELSFAMMGVVGASLSITQSIVLGFFSFYAIYSNTGRAIFVALIFHALAILVDLIVLGHMGRQWFNESAQNAWTALMMVIGLFVKLLGGYYLFKIMQSTGFAFPDYTSIPSEVKETFIITIYYHHYYYHHYY
jgi:hypothetical protein